MKQKEPTEWVNIMVVGNEGTQIRIYIQPKTLKNIEDVMDVVSGIWLDKTSLKLYTFIALFKRHRFIRMLFKFVDYS